MNTESNVVELFEERPLVAASEDYIAFIEEGDNYIYYVRNYDCQQELIIVSNAILEAIPVRLRPITNVFVPSNFHVLKRFSTQIRAHLIKSQQMNHFFYLFNKKNISEFFDCF